MSGKWQATSRACIERGDRVRVTLRKTRIVGVAEGNANYLLTITPDGAGETVLIDPDDGWTLETRAHPFDRWFPGIEKQLDQLGVRS